MAGTPTVMGQGSHDETNEQRAADADGAALRWSEQQGDDEAMAEAHAEPPPRTVADHAEDGTGRPPRRSASAEAGALRRRESQPED